MFESVALCYDTPKKKGEKDDPYMIDSLKLKNQKEKRVRGRSNDLNGIKRVIDFNSYELGESCKEKKLVTQHSGNTGDKQPCSKISMLR